jgi:hypothetical protein
MGVSKIWSWVPWDLEPGITALAKASSNLAVSQTNQVTHEKTNPSASKRRPHFQNTNMSRRKQKSWSQISMRSEAKNGCAGEGQQQFNWLTWDCKPDTRLPILLLAHNIMGLTPANLVFRTEFCLSCNLLFRAPPPHCDKEQPTIDHAADLVNHLTSTIKPANIWSWPVIEWKPVTTAWPTAQATKTVTKCGYITQPALKESHPSFNPHGGALTG